MSTLLIGPLHGYGVAKVIRSNSTDSLDIEFGSLYPVLKRLEMKGSIVSKWEKSELNRRAKFFSQWLDFASAVARVTGPEPEGQR